jgi:hypothetical protein
MNTEDIKRMALAYQAVIEKKLDPVNHSALKKDFKDREDKDIDNDGDIDKSDEYLHKRRKAISKSVKGETATMNPKIDSNKSTSAEQKEETEVEENYNWKVSHAGKHVYVKAPHAGAAVKKAQKEYGNMNLTRAKIKNLGKIEMPANEAVNSADKKPENYMGPDGKMHTRMVPTKKGVVKKESTIRDRLMAILGEKKSHGNTDQKQAYDDNWSPSAKKMKADHEPEVKADATVAAADTAAAATKPVKVATKRPNDKTDGDKSVVNPVKDNTKGGMKESLLGLMNAYKSIKS